MLRRYGTCGKCIHWRQGAEADMMKPVVAKEDADTGVCEAAFPMTFEVGGVLINAQPETHRSRSCSDFSNGDRRPDGGDDDGPDDGDGEPVPAPRSRVRQLFPITPAPIAA